MKLLSRLFECIPLRDVLLEHSFSSESSIYLICLSLQSLFQMSVFPRTNLKAWMQLTCLKYPLCHLHLWSSLVQLVSSVSTSKFFSMFTRALHSALSVLHKVLLLGGKRGDPRKKGNIYSWRRGESCAVSSPGKTIVSWNWLWILLLIKLKTFNLGLHGVKLIWSLYLYWWVWSVCA